MGGRALGLRLLLETSAHPPAVSPDETAMQPLPVPAPSSAFMRPPQAGPAPRHAPPAITISYAPLVDRSGDTSYSSSYSSPSSPYYSGYGSGGYYWHFPYWSIFFIFLAITALLVGAMAYRKRQLATSSAAGAPASNGGVSGVGGSGGSYPPPPYTTSQQPHAAGGNPFGPQPAHAQQRPTPYMVPMTEAYVPYGQPYGRDGPAGAPQQGEGPVFGRRK